MTVVRRGRYYFVATRDALRLAKNPLPASSARLASREQQGEVSLGPVSTDEWVAWDDLARRFIASRSAHEGGADAAQPRASAREATPSKSDKGLGA